MIFKHKTNLMLVPNLMIPMYWSVIAGQAVVSNKLKRKKRERNLKKVKTNKKLVKKIKLLSNHFSK